MYTNPIRVFFSATDYQPKFTAASNYNSKKCSLTYLNFVCIHTSICNKNFSIFNSLWLIYSNFFIQQKAYNIRIVLY